MFSLCSSNVQDVCISILMLSSQSSCASIEHNLVCVCICVCVHTVCVHRQASLGLRATGSQLTRGPIYHYTHALQVNVTDTHVAKHNHNWLQLTPFKTPPYSSTHIIPANRCRQHPHANLLFTLHRVAHKHHKKVYLH